MKLCRKIINMRHNSAQIITCPLAIGVPQNLCKEEYYLVEAANRAVPSSNSSSNSTCIHFELCLHKTHTFVAIMKTHCVYIKIAVEAESKLQV